MGFEADDIQNQRASSNICIRLVLSCPAGAYPVKSATRVSNGRIVNADVGLEYGAGLRDRGNGASVLEYMHGTKEIERSRRQTLRPNDIAEKLPNSIDLAVDFAKDEKFETVRASPCACVRQRAQWFNHI